MRETIVFWIRELCTRKLAQQLFKCVECAHSDRAMTDWFCAKHFVWDNPSLVDEIIVEFVGKLALEGKHLCLPAWLYLDFGAFERLCGYAVWDKMFQRLKDQLNLQSQPPQGSYAYTRVRFS